MFVFLHSNTRH